MSEFDKILTELGFSDEFIGFIDKNKYHDYSAGCAGMKYDIHHITQKGTSEYTILDVDTSYGFKDK